VNSYHRVASLGLMRPVCYYLILNKWCHAQQNSPRDSTARHGAICWRIECRDFRAIAVNWEVSWQQLVVMLYDNKQSCKHLNPLMATLKPHSNGPLHSNTVIGTLAVDGWAVTFGTAKRGLGGLRPRPVPSSCTKYNRPPINSHCINFILFDVAL